jgi:hypothetical protein
MRRERYSAYRSHARFHRFPLSLTEVLAGSLLLGNAKHVTHPFFSLCNRSLQRLWEDHHSYMFGSATGLVLWVRAGCGMDARRGTCKCDVTYLNG